MHCTMHSYLIKYSNGALKNGRISFRVDITRRLSCGKVYSNSCFKIVYGMSIRSIRSIRVSFQYSTYSARGAAETYFGIGHSGPRRGEGSAWPSLKQFQTNENRLFTIVLSLWPNIFRLFKERVECRAVLPKRVTTSGVHCGRGSKIKYNRRYARFFIFFFSRENRRSRLRTKSEL